VALWAGLPFLAASSAEGVRRAQFAVLASKARAAQALMRVRSTRVCKEAKGAFFGTATRLARAVTSWRPPARRTSEAQALRVVFTIISVTIVIIALLALAIARVA